MDYDPSLPLYLDEQGRIVWPNEEIKTVIERYEEFYRKAGAKFLNALGLAHNYGPEE